MRRLDVRLSDAALSDLDEVGYHVFKSTLNSRLARAYSARIKAACERIGEASEGGRPRPDLGAGIRTWAFERRAVILYRVGSVGFVIERIIHRGRQLRLLSATDEAS